MSGKEHLYELTLVWSGDEGVGTRSYGAYRRDHEIAAEGRPPIPGTSDPQFRGDPTRWNPEQLLVASLSSCHMLWYLHLCSQNGVIVRSYEDRPLGTMIEEGGGAGRFTSVVLRPTVVVDPGSDVAVAHAQHGKAHQFCFIARSMNFPVEHKPRILVRGD